MSIPPNSPEAQASPISRNTARPAKSNVNLRSRAAETIRKEQALNGALVNHAHLAIQAGQEKLEKLHLAEVAAAERVEELEALAQQYEQSDALKLVREIEQQLATLSSLQTAVENAELRLKMQEQRSQVAAQQHAVAELALAETLLAQNSLAGQSQSAAELNEKLAELRQTWEVKTAAMAELEAELSLIRLARESQETAHGRLSEAVFLEIVKDLIKLADHAEAARESAGDSSVRAQFDDFRKALLSTLYGLRVSEVVIEPGTPVDRDLGQKLVISEHHEGTGSPRVLAMLMPGYAMLDEAGHEVFLRKPVVVTGAGEAATERAQPPFGLKVRGK